MLASDFVRSGFQLPVVTQKYNRPTLRVVLIISTSEEHVEKYSFTQCPNRSRIIGPCALWRRDLYFYSVGLARSFLFAVAHKNS